MFYGRHAQGCCQVHLSLHHMSTNYLNTPSGLLQPTTPPSTVWEDIATEFVTGLPTFQRQFIVVVMDRFSKAVHFGALPSHFSVCKAAKIFYSYDLQAAHGLPPRVLLRTEVPSLSVDSGKF